MRDEIEAAIQDKGLTAPRLTPGMIADTIVSEEYYVFPGTSLMVCCLTLKNGYHVTGESASVSIENFDEEIGKRVSRNKAAEKIWSLEGYLLRDKLCHSKAT